MKTDRDLFMRKRVLFIREWCPHCAKYLEFIERININMLPSKRIEVIDCAKWQETGIVDNMLIKKYARYIDGFPCLFFEGKKISGTNSREEAEAFLKTMCAEDLQTEVTMPPTFDYDCKHINTIWGKRILCN